MKEKAIVLSSYEFMRKFNTEFKCLKFLEKMIWKNGIKCQFCSSKRISKRNKKTGFFQCKDCRKKFNVRTGTIFHRSKIKLNKWLYASKIKGGGNVKISKKVHKRPKSQHSFRAFERRVEYI